MTTEHLQNESWAEIRKYDDSLRDVDDDTLVKMLNEWKEKIAVSPLSEWDRLRFNAVRVEIYDRLSQENQGAY